MQFLTQFVHIRVESNARILGFYQYLVGPDHIVTINTKTHLFSYILNYVFSSLVSVEKNIDLFSHRILIILTKCVNACLDVIYVLLLIVLVDIPTFQHGKKTFMLFQSHLQQFLSLFPFLTLVKNPSIANSISHNHNTAARTMLSHHS